MRENGIQEERRKGRRRRHGGEEGDDATRCLNMATINACSLRVASSIWPSVCPVLFQAALTIPLDIYLYYPLVSESAPHICLHTVQALELSI